MNSKFFIEDTYVDAVKNTASNLVPLAAKLKELEDEADYIPDPGVTNQFNYLHSKPPCLCIVTTTKFSDPMYDGKWGFAHIEEDLRQSIAYILEKLYGSETWIYFSQRWEE